MKDLAILSVALFYGLLKACLFALGEFALFFVLGSIPVSFGAWLYGAADVRGVTLAAACVTGGLGAFVLNLKNIVVALANARQEARIARALSGEKE